jgi:hypothetical protein
MGVIGARDDMDAGFGVETNGEVFRFAALTGHFEDLLGVNQKAAHKTLIGEVSWDYREFLGYVPTRDDTGIAFVAQNTDGRGRKRKEAAAIGTKAKPTGG